MNLKRTTFAALTLCLLGTGFIIAKGDESAAPADASLFTEEQVSAGEMAYRQSCAECHGIRLGGGMGPALNDDAFMRGWGDRSVLSLDTYTRTEMPLGVGGSLSEETYSQIMAFLLSNLGHEAGSQVYSPSMSGLDSILVDPQLQ